MMYDMLSIIIHTYLLLIDMHIQNSYRGLFFFFFPLVASACAMPTATSIAHTLLHHAAAYASCIHPSHTHIWDTIAIANP
jgi:hypothetical protein